MSSFIKYILGRPQLAFSFDHALSTSTVLVWLVPAVYTCTEKVLHCNVVGGDCQTYSVGWGAIIHSYLRNDLPLLISERSQHSAHA